jgi:hypothetical protein
MSTQEGSRASEQPGADPLALAIFGALRDRPESDRLFVYRALSARCSAGPSENPERVELALNALALCMQDAGGDAPSRRRYDAWRSEQERPDEWPSSTAIRNTFAGSWAKAIDALGVRPAPDVLARRLLDFTHGYKAEEALAAIHACVAALQPTRLSFATYRQWAREELHNPDRAVERLPLSEQPFLKNFGSWGEALAAAGLADLLRTRGKSGDRRPQGPREAYSEERIRDALRQATSDLGTDQLTTRQYEKWRKSRIDDAHKEGRVIHLPGPQAVQFRFDSWPRALLKAGLISEEKAQLTPQHGSRTWSNDELLGWLVLAMQTIPPPVIRTRKGGRPSSAIHLAEYRQWRLERLRRAKDVSSRPPSDVVIGKRFGSWAEATKLAALRAAEEEDPR